MDSLDEVDHPARNVAVAPAAAADCCCRHGKAEEEEAVEAVAQSHHPRALQKKAARRSVLRVAPAHRSARMPSRAPLVTMRHMPA